MVIVEGNVGSTDVQANASASSVLFIAFQCLKTKPLLSKILREQTATHLWGKKSSSWRDTKSLGIFWYADRFNLTPFGLSCVDLIVGTRVNCCQFYYEAPSHLRAVAASACSGVFVFYIAFTVFSRWNALYITVLRTLGGKCELKYTYGERRTSRGSKLYGGNSLGFPFGLRLR